MNIFHISEYKIIILGKNKQAKLNKDIIAYLNLLTA